MLPDKSLLIGQKLLENSELSKIQMRHFEYFSNTVHFKWPHIQQILSNELVILTYSPGMHKAMNEVKVRNSPVRNGCGQESVSERSFT